jgi:hypothetical protein
VKSGATLPRRSRTFVLVFFNVIDSRKCSAILQQEVYASIYHSRRIRNRSEPDDAGHWKGDEESQLLQKMTIEQLTEFINEQVNLARPYEIHARRAGMALNVIKKRMEHGEWESWLADHFNGSPRTARRYMALAEEPLVIKTTAVKTATGVAVSRPSLRP